MKSLSDIVNRPIEGPHDVPEMEFVVGEYIRVRKGVQVVVNITKGILIPDHPLSRGRYLKQVQKLSYAFNVAVDWFRKNPQYL